MVRGRPPNGRASGGTPDNPFFLKKEIGQVKIYTGSWAVANNFGCFVRSWKEQDWKTGLRNLGKRHVNGPCVAC